DDELRPAATQVGGGGFAGRLGIAEVDVRPAGRRGRRVRRRETEEADATAGALQHPLARGATERSPRAPLDDIRAEPGEARLRHPLTQDARAKVELVVAEGRDVEGDGVEDG